VSISELLMQIALGAVVGMLGQGLRVIVGLKKKSDLAASPNLSDDPVAFDTQRLLTSLFIGAIAGALGMLSLTNFAPPTGGAVSSQQFFSLIGIGYAGTDFIEGFILRYLPKQGVPVANPQVLQFAPATLALAAPPTAAERIIERCKAQLAVTANAASCSNFVIAVAADFTISLTGQANNIVDQLQSGGWTVYDSATDSSAGRKAQEAAQRGDLVVGGLKADPNGHVVIVVARQSGDPAASYPYAYWGKLNHPEQAGWNKTVNWAWNKDDRDRVLYASRLI